MGPCVGRRQADHSTTGSTDSSLSHSGNRQRQLPFQKLNYPDQQGEENRRKNQKLSHNLAPRVGQFSVQNPGQISVQINSTGLHRSLFGPDAVRFNYQLPKIFFDLGNLLVLVRREDRLLHKPGHPIDQCKDRILSPLE